MLSEKELVERLETVLPKSTREGIMNIIKENDDVVKKLLESDTMHPVLLQSISMAVDKENIKKVYANKSPILLKIKEVQDKIEENKFEIKDLEDIKYNDMPFCYIATWEWNKIEKKVREWEQNYRKIESNTNKKIEELNDKLKRYLELNGDGEKEITKNDKSRIKIIESLTNMNCNNQSGILKGIVEIEDEEKFQKELEKKIIETIEYKEFHGMISSYLGLKKELLDEKSNERSEEIERIKWKIENYGFDDDIFAEIENSISDEEIKNKYIKLFENEIKEIKKNRASIIKVRKKCEEIQEEQNKDRGDKMEKETFFWY